MASSKARRIVGATAAAGAVGVALWAAHNKPVSPQAPRERPMAAQFALSQERQAQANKKVSSYLSPKDLKAFALIKPRLPNLQAADYIALLDARKHSGVPNLPLDHLLSTFNTPQLSGVINLDQTAQKLPLSHPIAVLEAEMKYQRGAEKERRERVLAVWKGLNAYVRESNSNRENLRAAYRKILSSPGLGVFLKQNSGEFRKIYGSKPK